MIAPFEVARDVVCKELKMDNSVDLSGKPFHFIGIGGIGMSALAYIVANRNLPVSGSDIRPSNITDRLQAAGVQIFIGQQATNLDAWQPLAASTSQPLAVGAIANGSGSKYSTKSKTSSVATALKPPASLPQVICSTAINPANPELRAALEKGCPVFHRSELLAALIREYQSIAVAGTHGKTTTSSMVGYLLLEAGLDPTIVVGGEVEAWEGNARAGKSEYLVAEADESDKSLVRLAPKIGVVTNIELDHPDHYDSLEEVINIFETFAQQCEILVGCIDCELVRTRLQPTISYSLDRERNADYSVDRIAYNPDGTIARVWERGEILGELELKLLGEHNLQNALAAVAIGRYLGLEFETIARAIATFGGAKRRFEVRGEANGIRFIDDYAHHPSELLATLAAARLQVKESGRLVAIFQPHRYSRTLTFLAEFARSFVDADLVVLTDIYSAGEPNLGQIDGERLAERVRNYHPHVNYQESIPAVRELLGEILKPGDLALFLGAGNLNQVIPEVMAHHQRIDKTQLVK
jgi:UDP-N-acetylmuramate--alanine ligase